MTGVNRVALSVDAPRAVARWRAEGPPPAADPVLRHPDRPSARRSEEKRRRRFTGVAAVIRPATAPTRPPEADRGPTARRECAERAGRRRERIGREEPRPTARLPPRRRRAGEGELRPPDERAGAGASIPDLDRAGEILGRSLQPQRRRELRGLAGGSERRVRPHELRPSRKPWNLSGATASTRAEDEHSPDRKPQREK